MGSGKWVMTEVQIFEALEDGGVKMDRSSYVGTFEGKKIRLNINGIVDIGDDNFDRWANSVAASFTPHKGRFSRQFKRAIQEAEEYNK